MLLLNGRIWLIIENTLDSKREPYCVEKGILLSILDMCEDEAAAGEDIEESNP